jgi:hypothetical protein
MYDSKNLLILVWRKHGVLEDVSVVVCDDGGV